MAIIDIEELRRRRDTSPWTPDNLSPGFWEVVAAAKRDEERLRKALEAMSREEMIAFYVEYFDAAIALTEPEWVEHMAEGTSEDGADDVSRWVVGQGEAYYREVYDHPERTPEDVPGHSKDHLFYVIAPVFHERFDEDIVFAVDELGLS